MPRHKKKRHVTEKRIPPPITAKGVRLQIVRLEELQRKIQIQTPREKSLIQRNRMIYLLDNVKQRIRDMYFVLHNLKEQGVIQKEIDIKRMIDWQEKKCPKCEQAKLDDDGKCLSPHCDYEVKKEFAE